MLDPGFRGEYRTDDHSWADIRYGQRFIREVFRAFARRRIGSAASSC